jgi:hypothetical protein
MDTVKVSNPPVGAGVTLSAPAPYVRVRVWAEVRLTPLTVIVEPTTDTTPVEAVVLDVVGTVQPAGTATLTLPEVRVAEAVYVNFSEVGVGATTDNGRTEAVPDPATEAVRGADRLAPTSAPCDGRVPADAGATIPTTAIAVATATSGRCHLPSPRRARPITSPPCVIAPGSW